ncbi:MAG: winged helix-turn-helix domain-containing protein [Acidobacteriota bacterium]
MPVVDARIRFGPFELDSRTGELRTKGTRVKLQGQPISVLEILLETPGELVTREQIRERLWSSDTFVDFDHNLNTAIKKLRQALGDEAETPRFIETIPKYGYRFIGQVEKNAAPEVATSLPEGSGTEVTSAEPQPAPRRASRLRRTLPWALGITTIVFIAIAAYFMLLPKAPQAAVVRFSIAPPENASFPFGQPAISPDGHTLAFVAQTGPNKSRVLWVRPLDSLTAEPIPGTEGARLPFWSPDSQEIGFSAEGKLEKVALAGGQPKTICYLTGPSAAASWNRDGVILFSNHLNRGSLYRVPDTGGTPTLVVAPDPLNRETGYWLPQFLPDGRHFLFLANTGASGEYILEAGTLDSKSVEKNLAQLTSFALYAPPGYLLYVEQRTLVARAFNARALHFTGPALKVVDNVGIGSGIPYVSVSATGLLAYANSPDTNLQMAWFNREGQQLGTLGPPGVYSQPALSPDGTRLAVEVGNYGERDIWVFETKRGTASRLTFNPADDSCPVWAGDGSRILFSSDRNGQIDIYQKNANGLGSEQPVFQSKDQAKELNDSSADGRYAIYSDAGSSTSKQLRVLPLFGERKPFVFKQGAFGAHSASFSPNGRYVAYASNETGRLEVYVESFPRQTGKWEVSTSGGAEPVWRRDGKELYYLTPDDKLMAVAVSTVSGKFQAGIPKELFQAKLPPIAFWRNLYVASPDGQRFLMVVPANEVKPAPITVVVNWPALLKE